MLDTEPYREAKPLTNTFLESGRVVGRRESLLLMLETKFGALSDEVRRRVERLEMDQLDLAIVGIISGKSLAELGLEADEAESS